MLCFEISGPGYRICSQAVPLETIIMDVPEGRVVWAVPARLLYEDMFTVAPVRFTIIYMRFVQSVAAGKVIVPVPEVYNQTLAVLSGLLVPAT